MADWKSVVDVISNALGMISSAASTPGINLIPYVNTVAVAASTLQAGLNAAVNVAPYIIAIKDTFSGTLPTEAELAALRVKIAELEAIVDAPLPPKEDGEPD